MVRYRPVGPTVRFRTLLALHDYHGLESLDLWRMRDRRLFRCAYRFDHGADWLGAKKWAVRDWEEELNRAEEVRQSVLFAKAH